MDGKKLVAKIKAQVVARGMTMQEFYKLCGITGGALSQWKSGETQPTLPRLQKISDVLQISLSELLDEETKTPATENGDGRYGLTRAEWEQIGRIFYNKVYAIGKAPGWLASEQTGLSVGDVDDFLAGKRYITKAQIHAMADRLGMSLWDVIGSYAQAFDGEEDVDVANRQEAIKIIGSYDSESLAQALSYLRYLAASSNPPPKQSQEDA